MCFLYFVIDMNFYLLIFYSLTFYNITIYFHEQISKSKLYISYILIIVYDIKVLVFYIFLSYITFIYAI